jgi:hypothetical protein
MCATSCFSALRHPGGYRNGGLPGRGGFNGYRDSVEGGLRAWQPFLVRHPMLSCSLPPYSCWAFKDDLSSTSCMQAVPPLSSWGVAAQAAVGVPPVAGSMMMMTGCQACQG